MRFWKVLFIKEISNHFSLVFQNVHLTKVLIICWSCCLYPSLANTSYKIVNSINEIRERARAGIFWFCVNCLGGILPAPQKGTVNSSEGWGYWLSVRETPWCLMTTFSGLPSHSPGLQSGSRNIQSRPSLPPTDSARPSSMSMDFLMAQQVNNLPAKQDTRDLDLIPGSGRSPGGGHGNPLQDSCLENPSDRGAWRATVHGGAKSQRQLSNFTFFSFFLSSS